ncbi:MAG: restriction endonuclease [Spirulina sp. DLM2.Bin59]|nr:MAG: restriction endonuclease [Spirulina sp. DLM2.Bin59]
MKPTLTIKQFCAEAAQFAAIESTYDEPTLYGVTDGKAVGTYLEHKFTAYLAKNYSYQLGNSASGIDVPELEIDIKVTSGKQPQSSCPFKSAAQKIYGLGYHLLIFVYDKYDDSNHRTARLDIQHTIFVNKSRTADFQTTRGILEILDRDGNKDDIIAFLQDRNLPVDEIGANQLADQILASPPSQGYLTISNALQWRLQYRRVIQQAGNISEIIRVR